MKKCPHCGAEVKPGTIFCPECLTEISWVPEYNTVETLMNREKLKKEKGGRPGTGRQKWKLRKAILLFVVVLGLIGVASKLMVDYRQYQSFDYQYEQAQKALEKEQYDRAGKHIERALELEPSNLSANLLDAGILYAQGDQESAESMLEMLVSEYPSSIDAYGALIAAYEDQGKFSSIRELLSNTRKEEIREHFSEYLVADPDTSEETGVYNEALTVKLFSEDEAEIYYTLDGTDPTAESTRYVDPLLIDEGVTELKAVCINERQIPSDIIYRKYTVVIKGPDAPKITPEAGSYSAPVKITMEVPDGCKGFYSFDTPTVSTASQEYTGPVEMPEGEHVFYAILVAANGKESETVSMSYHYAPAEDDVELAE